RRHQVGRLRYRSRAGRRGRRRADHRGGHARGGREARSIGDRPVSVGPHERRTRTSVAVRGRMMPVVELPHLWREWLWPEYHNTSIVGGHSSLSSTPKLLQNKTISPSIDMPVRRASSLLSSSVHVP